MNILETAMSSMGGGAVSQLASKFGLEPNQVSSVLSAAAPHLASGMQQKLESGEGDHLKDLVTNGTLDQVAANPEAVAQPEVEQHGQSLLQHLFGAGHQEQVANDVAQKSGVDPSIVSSLLPAAAALLAGHLAKQSGGDTNQLSSLLGALGGAGNTGGAGGMLGTLKGMAAGLFQK